MSVEAYEKKLFDSEMYQKLKESEIEAKTTNKRFDHREIINDLRTRVAGNQF